MIAALLRGALALAFVASALAKAADFHATAAFFASVLPVSATAARALLAVLVLVELGAAAAVALRAGPERLVLGGVLVLLGAFTLQAGWMAAAGIDNCGCFGTRFEVGPGATIVKNVVLMAMAAALLWRGRAPARGLPRTLETLEV